MVQKMLPRLLTIVRNTTDIYNLLLNNVTPLQRPYTCMATNDHRSAVVRFGISRCFSDRSRKCWNCNFTCTSELFCSKCKSLQELPKDSTYFDIMGIAQHYDVSSDKLRDEYRRLQSLLHPDKYSNKSEKEKRISESLSAFVNEAYSTLMHPLNRGLYILKTNNISISEGTTNLNASFLSEIMERNEELEEASHDKVRVLALAKENEQILQKLTRAAAEAFRTNNLEEAKRVLIKMKYYTSLDHKLKQLKQRLDIID